MGAEEELLSGEHLSATGQLLEAADALMTALQQILKEPAIHIAKNLRW